MGIGRLVEEHSRLLDASELFVGLFSSLDGLLSRTMSDALDNLPLPPTTADALLGRHNQERSVLDAVIA